MEIGAAGVHVVFPVSVVRAVGPIERVGITEEDVALVIDGETDGAVRPDELHLTVVAGDAARRRAAQSHIAEHRVDDVRSRPLHDERRAGGDGAARGHVVEGQCQFARRGVEARRRAVERHGRGIAHLSAANLDVKRQHDGVPAAVLEERAALEGDVDVCHSVELTDGLGVAGVVGKAIGGEGLEGQAVDSCHAAAAVDVCAVGGECLAAGDVDGADEGRGGDAVGGVAPAEGDGALSGVDATAGSDVGGVDGGVDGAAVDGDVALFGEEGAALGGDADDAAVDGDIIGGVDAPIADAGEAACPSRWP